MTDLKPTDNMNTQDPGAHSDGGPFPGQKPDPVDKDIPKKEVVRKVVPTPKMKTDDLPGEHAPTVPLPGAKAATAKAVPEKPAVAPPPPAPKAETKEGAKPEETSVPKKEDKEVVPSPAIKKKPDEVELPGEESPELAETVSVWPKTGPKKATDTPVTPPAAETPPLTTKEDVKDAKPTLEIGPVVSKKKPNTKKILIIVGSVIGVLFLAGVAYGFLSNAEMPEVMEEPVEEEVVEEVVEEPVEVEEEDVTSIDFLEDYYDGVGEKVKILEDSVNFEETLKLLPNKI